MSCPWLYIGKLSHGVFVIGEMKFLIRERFNALPVEMQELITDYLDGFSCLRLKRAGYEVRMKTMRALYFLLEDDEDDSGFVNFEFSPAVRRRRLFDNLSGGIS